jgi:ribosomal protein L11 methyltransferase
VPRAQAELLRARFLELAPEGFEEVEHAGGIELAAYGEAAARVLGAFPDASLGEVAEGWEDGWRAFHRPVEIGPLWVGPPWLSAPPGALAVVIDPGRAFGTGAHATTRLCLELLLAERRAGMIDLGCGSGVIAIAAAKLGFAPVLALDIDPVALEVAGANARANAVEIELREGDAGAASLPEAALAVANIALAEVGRLGASLPAGRLIASGYRSGETPAPYGFARIGRRELDGWAADLFARR